MYRGTTPTLSIKVNSQLDITDMEQIWVTLKSQSSELTLDKDRVNVVTTEEETKLILQLTQEETLGFINGVAKIQVRFLSGSGMAYASNIKEVNINQILKEGVIS